MEKYFSVSTVEYLEDTPETEKLGRVLNGLESVLESIDEGGNATVFYAKDPEYQKVCFKMCKEKPQIKYNDIREERRYQSKARKNGVRTPLTLFAVKTIANEEFLVMEKIEGCTVEQAVNDPSLLPENFDYWTFCNDLEDQISKLHQTNSLSGTGIYHRDLHARNVMINKEGLAVIIDFGTATEGTGGEFTYEESVAMYNPKTNRYDFVTGYFKNDDEMVRNIKALLKSFMK